MVLIAKVSDRDCRRQTDSVSNSDGSDTVFAASSKDWCSYVACTLWSTNPGLLKVGMARHVGHHVTGSSRFHCSSRGEMTGTCTNALTGTSRLHRHNRLLKVLQRSSSWTLLHQQSCNLLLSLNRLLLSEQFSSACLGSGAVRLQAPCGQPRAVSRLCKEQSFCAVYACVARGQLASLPSLAKECAHERSCVGSL